jgi:hypothetical protein
MAIGMQSNLQICSRGKVTPGRLSVIALPAGRDPLPLERSGLVSKQTRVPS